MRIIVCDDNPKTCNIICKMIKFYFVTQSIQDVDIVGYLRGETVLNDNKEMDIVFMDMELPGINGVDVTQKLKERNPNTIIIFVTAHEQYSDDAFRLNAFRYLHKPFSEGRFFKILEDAVELYYSACGKIVIENKDTVYAKYKSDIIFIESIERGCIVHLRDGMYYSPKTMKEISKTLDKGCFVQSHRSYIVNLNYVSHFDKENVYFEDCETVAYLSQRKYANFKKLYEKYTTIMKKNNNKKNNNKKNNNKKNNNNKNKV